MTPSSHGKNAASAASSADGDEPADHVAQEEVGDEGIVCGLPFRSTDRRHAHAVPLHEEEVDARGITVVIAGRIATWMP